MVKRVVSDPDRYVLKEAYEGGRKARLTFSMEVDVETFTVARALNRGLWERKLKSMERRALSGLRN